MTRNQRRRVRNIKRGIELCRIFSDDDRPYAWLYPYAPEGARILRNAGRIEKWETVGVRRGQPYCDSIRGDRKSGAAERSDNVLWWRSRSRVVVKGGYDAWKGTTL